MAKITNIEIRPLLGNTQYNSRIFVSTEGFDAKRHRLILRGEQKFYDELNGFFIKDLYINPQNSNPNHPLSAHLPDTSLYWSVYAQLYDYKADEIISTKRQDFKKELLTWQKDGELVSVSEGNFNVFWNNKRRVEKVEGPYGAKGLLVEEVKAGETYKFIATPNQALSETQLLSVKWAYKYDGGELTPFKNHEERISKNGNAVMTCSFHAEPKNIKVYAYFFEPSENVSVEFNNFGKAEDLEEQKPVSESSNQNENQTDNKSDKFIITEDFLDGFMSKAGHGTISKVAPYNKRIPAYIDYLNLYMEKFGIKDSNQRMAHFLGQVAKETKFWSYNEDFIFGKGKLSETFKNFKTEESKPYAKKWEYKTNSKAITKEIQIQVANYAYARPTKASDFNNVICDLNNLKDPKQDGYNYRGRGLIQITGRNNYGEFQAWYNKHQKELELEKIDFLKNPDKVLEPINVVLSAIYFWDKNKLNNLADKGIEEKHILAISNVINSGEDDSKKKIRKDYVEKAFQCLEKLKEDKHIDGKELKSKINSKWHDPIDKPMLCLYTQNGNYRPRYNVFGKVRIERQSPLHQGVDLLAVPGKEVYACVDSYVEYIQEQGGYGKVICLRVKDKENFLKFKKEDFKLQYSNEGEILYGNNFNFDGEIYLFYGHLQKTEELIIGKEINCGKIIGYTGTSGYGLSKDPHLHFEIRNKKSSPGLSNRCHPGLFVNYKDEKTMSKTEKEYHKEIAKKYWD